MTIIIETEEDIRRAKLFSDSVNARWLSALKGRSTPALMYYKTREPGKFEYVHIGWSKESERTERKAVAELEKMSAEDGVYNGEATGYGYWLGVPYSEYLQFHDDQDKANTVHHHSLDEAVKILQDAISRIEVNVDPRFPPIGDLYFSIARIYFEHERYEDHDVAYEKGLSFALENLETRPRYFGYNVAEKLKKLAHIYLDRDQLTPALGIYARLKHARTLAPAAVAAVMHEDWNLVAEFYERHGKVDEAAACYRSIGEQIDWMKGPEYEQWEKIRTAASSLIRLGKHADAEHIYEQLLDWGLSKNRIKTEKGLCFHVYPCGHWFEPYFQLLHDQNRLQHRSEVFEKLGMDESDYLPARSEDLFGYVDLQGQWKIPQRFEEAGNFKEGRARVLLTPAEATYARSQLIDTSGKIVGPDTGPWSHLDLPVPKGYRQTERMYEGLVTVMKLQEKSSPYPGSSAPSEFGYADENGNLVIEARFTEAHPFYRGVAIVAIGGYIGSAGGCVIKLQQGKYGLIDRTGKYLIEPQFRRLGSYNEEFDDGLFTYERGDEGGVITKTGEIRSVLPGCNDTFYCSDGMAEVAWGEREPNDSRFGNQKYGYLDASGKVVIEPKFENAWSFVGDRAMVCQKGKSGFINRKCEMIIDAIYDTAKQFKHQLALIQLEGKWGCINEDGAFVVEPLYDTIEWTKDEDTLLLVETNEKLGLIDRSGKVLCPPRFDSIDPFVEGFAIVSLQGLKGMIDTSGSLKLEARFHDLKPFSEGFSCAATKDDDGSLFWGYIDSDGNFAVAASFAQAEPFSEGLAAVRPFGCNSWGFVSSDGKFAIEPKFDSVNSFCNGRARVGIGTANGDKRFGIIDSHGNYVLAPEYAQVGPQYYDGLCSVGKKQTSSQQK